MTNPSAERIAKAGANCSAIAAGICAGMLFFSDLTAEGQSRAADGEVGWLLLVSDVLFSLAACVLTGALVRFLLWDCLFEPLLARASRGSMEKSRPEAS